MEHHTEKDTAGSYCIKRFYEREKPPEIIRTGLTLEEAMEWCTNPETSSTTATTAEARARTEAHGPWFDGYESEHPMPLDGFPNWHTREVALWLANSEETVEWVQEQLRASWIDTDGFALLLAEKAPAVIRREGCAMIDEDFLLVDWRHLADKLREGYEE